jgi:hypothetical protein
MWKCNLRPEKSFIAFSLTGNCTFPENFETFLNLKSRLKIMALGLRSPWTDRQGVIQILDRLVFHKMLKKKLFVK